MIEALNEGCVVLPFQGCLAIELPWIKSSLLPRG